MIKEEEDLHDSAEQKELAESSQQVAPPVAPSLRSLD
jgi:hypothetical protein